MRKTMTINLWLWTMIIRLWKFLIKLNNLLNRFLNNQKIRNRIKIVYSLKNNLSTNWLRSMGQINRARNTWLSFLSLIFHIFFDLILQNIFLGELKYHSLQVILTQVNIFSATFNRHHDLHMYTWNIMSAIYFVSG